jgi:glycosyltransferase involved in cell wall biosynthesis
MTPVRVLHVLGALEGGGIQTFLLALLQHHDREGFSADVCEMAVEPGPLVHVAREAGAQVFQCSLSDSPMTFARRFAALLKQGKYDVVHVHRSSNVQAIPLRIAAENGVRVRVAHYQNVRTVPGVFSLRGFTDPSLRRMVVRNSTSIIGVSRAVLDSHFGGHWRNDPRFAVVPNAIDLQRYSPADRAAQSDEFIIGHAGRFSAAKNHALIIDCAARLKGRIPGLRFLIAGDGPLRGEIEELIRERDVQDCVRLLGWQENMPDFLRGLDVFFFPSLWEGLPLALIEAQASGLPCVASSIPSNQEVLSPEALEWTAEPQDTERFAELLEKLWREKDSRLRLSQEARSHAAAFDIRTIARRIESLYLRQLEMPT